MDVPLITVDLLWRTSLALAPLALVVWAICRVFPLRATTRHSLWAVLLGVFLLAPLAGFLPARALLSSGARIGTALAAIVRAAPVAPRPGAAVRQTESPTPIPVPHSPPPVATAPLVAPEPLARELVELRAPAQPPAAATAPALASPATPPLEWLAAADLLASPLNRTSTHRPAPAWLSPKRAPTSTLADRPRSARAEPLLASRERVPAAHTPTLPPLTTAVPGPSPVPTPAVGASAPVAVPPLISTEASPAPAAPSAPTLSRLSDTLTHLRQAAASLPAIPRRVWLGGAALLIAALSLQIGICRFRLRRCFPATDAVNALVRLAADQMRLRRTPEVLMVARRVSPMIWCGLRTRLILPAELWDELDDAGRRAVINHELAHLRRRDHWLCWIELFACILYWWHPVVWWVRRRLREEADLCCDAWVTALMPQGRRAYAQALLNTQRFLGGQRVAPPATGLGVLSGGAKRFARRLTMVMTHRAPPHRSFTGVALAAVIALAGLSTASLACPDKDKDKEKKVKLEKEQAARAMVFEVQPTPRAARAPRGPRATTIRSQDGSVVVVTPEADEDQDATTYERHMRTRNQVTPAVPPAPPAPPAALSIPARRAAVAGRAGQLNAARAQQAEEVARARVIGRSAHGLSGQAAPDDDLDRRLDALERRLDKMEGRLDRMLEHLDRRGDAGERASPFGAAVAQGGDESQRSYTLPSGLADDVYQLLARQDVPVVINRDGDTIIVHGDPRTQEIVGRFFQIIAPGGQTNVLGMTEVTPEPLAPGAARAVDVTNKARREELRALRGAISAQGAARRGAADQLRARAKEMTRQAESLNRQLERSARAVETKEGAAREQAEAQAEALQAQVEAMQEAAQQLEEQADEIAEQLDEAVSEALDHLDEQLDGLEDAQLDTLGEIPAVLAMPAPTPMPTLPPPAGLTAIAAPAPVGPAPVTAPPAALAPIPPAPPAPAATPAPAPRK